MKKLMNLKIDDDDVEDDGSAKKWKVVSETD